MIKSLLKPRNLCISAVIAAIYTVLTMVLAPISYGNIQCRISEAMTVLPIIMPQAIPGLFVGCLLSNLFAPTPFLPDIIFGTLATLLAAIMTYSLRNRVHAIAFLPPVVMNALVVGTVVHQCYVPEVSLWLCMLEVGIGEAIAVYILGSVLLVALKKANIEKVVAL